MSEYRVIKTRRLPDREGRQPCEIILCELPGNTLTPFVTWQRNDPARGGDGGRYWGHYFADYEEAKARKDFETRGH